MSSSNRVRVTFIEESVLGTTPIAGDFDTARFISESLSGTPSTAESQQIRADRLPSGQVVTGLELGGDLNFELAKESQLEKFMQSAMFNTWDTQALQTVDLEIDATAKTIERASGDWNTTVDVGDFITLGGFVNSVNNTQAQVLEVVSPTVVRVSFNEANGPVVDEVATATTYKRADRLAVGTTKKSFSIEKAFLDLTNKAINYKGMMVDTMNLEVNYGEIVNGSFTFAGTRYEPADQASEFITNARTINPPATTNSMNGSIDMPIIASALGGTFGDVDFCIQSVGLTLNNNLSVQNCIGEIAPKDYSPGTAGVEVTLSTYLSDDNWEALALKLSQSPFALGFMIKNVDGWYGFYLPAVQVSFEDPASAGANQEVSLEMTGTGKVGANGESPLYIYRS
jgi:hypothetical protein